MTEVKRTERGFAGHFIAAKDCWFRRNTLLEAGNLRIVVSTVGNYNFDSRTAKELQVEPGPQEIGLDRYYETMAFYAKWEDPYWEADIGREIGFHSEWGIFGGVKLESDLEADEMHEAVVAELTSKMIKARKENSDTILEPDPLT